MSQPRDMMPTDVVSEESVDPRIVSDDELYQRVQSLEEDNAVLRAMLQRGGGSVHSNPVIHTIAQQHLVRFVDVALADLARIVQSCE